MRTAQLDGAHVEFFRGIANPMGVKIGPAMTEEWLQGLVTTLNPNNTPGRLTIIHRFGAKDVEKGLPQHDQGGARDRPAGALGLRPHARQHRDQLGRPQDAALREHPSRSRGFIPGPRGARLVPGRRAHRAHGEDVTECTGGARGLTDSDLARAYKSTVDPRLNYEQALELAMLIGKHGPAR
jgi:3-deoxy-7-phosphoheptulonate synthase